MKQENYEENAESDANMKKILISLSASKYWPAIKWWMDESQKTIDNTNRSIDPIKNPVNIARNQGMWLGVISLEAFIGELKERVVKEQKSDADEAEKNK